VTDTVFHLENFIAEHVTERTTSLFADDLATHHDELAARIDGRAALVIGGAGTIGSSFIRALLQFRPSKLYVVDNNENGLTELTRDLRSSVDVDVPDDYKTYPINFGDPVFAKLLANEGPFEIVANFAAHKHVRSEKDPYSIEAMIENNVLRAKHLLELLAGHPPERFFCVSTDKAANPVNIMGATKKLMEEVILAYSAEIPITTARFANVAFSNGSLPEGFLARMQRRQPLSAPEGIRRYFVSPAESGQLCLLACVLGESGDIFFPKLGEESMKTFTEIGDALLRDMGYEPVPCESDATARRMASELPDDSVVYPVHYEPADTSGEKSYEEFFTDDETLDLDRFAKLGVIKNAPRRSVDEIDEMFAVLRGLFTGEPIDKAAIVEALGRFIPNFEHIETGRHLDQKM